MKRMAPCYTLFDEEVFSVLESPLTESLGSSDKHWNMLSMSPQLHVWWSKAHLALKCLSVAPAVQSTNWTISL